MNNVLEQDHRFIFVLPVTDGWHSGIIEQRVAVQTVIVRISARGGQNLRFSATRLE